MAAGWRVVGGRLPGPATVPGMHSHHIAAALVTLAALAPSAASAQPVDTAAPLATQDLRSGDARDAADGRGTFNSPEIVVVKAPPTTRPAPADGIDWADAGIGAGGLLGVGLIALAVTHRRRGAVPAGL
jgi:hypothetical protein